MAGHILGAANIKNVKDPVDIEGWSTPQAMRYGAAFFRGTLVKGLDHWA